MMISKNRKGNVMTDSLPSGSKSRIGQWTDPETLANDLFHWLAFDPVEQPEFPWFVEWAAEEGYDVPYLMHKPWKFCTDFFRFILESQDDPECLQTRVSQLISR